MLALNKTKAALQGRLSHFSNIAENNTTLIDQVNACRFAHMFSNYGKSPGVTAAMARFSTVLQICNSLNAGGMRHWRSAQSPNFSGDLQSAENSADTWLAEKPADQPLGSIPRDCSSLRIIRLIHADTDASPSCASACLMPSSKPGSTRNAICLLPLPLISMVDIWLTPDYFEMVIKCMTGAYQKATPRTVRAVPRRLTKPLIEVTVMADIQSTQTHPKFTWRFLALSVTESSIVRITAATEREARNQSPVGCVMVFAGRLPVQGVSHA